MVFLADVPAGLSGVAFVKKAPPGLADSIFSMYPGSSIAIGPLGPYWPRLDAWKETLACILPVWISCSGRLVF